MAEARQRKHSADRNESYVGEFFFYLLGLSSRLAQARLLDQTQLRLTS